MDEWSFEVEWSQTLCSVVGFTKTNTELILYRHVTTLTSIQARIIFFLKIFLVISTDHRGYKHWSCQNVCDALTLLLDNCRLSK